jgi:hypothetical protein
MHDHTGNFSTALDGVNTVELQQADNDYAVGALVERLANSQYKDNTLVFVLEDDAQDGADHVDAHRSIFFVAGPYVKHGAVVSRPYTTVNLLRTIEDILGTDHLNIHTATVAPMAALFDLSQKKLGLQSDRFRLLEKYSITGPNWRLCEQIGSATDSRCSLLGGQNESIRFQRRGSFGQRREIQSDRLARPERSCSLSRATLRS